jgi:hypothetical protein
MLAPRFGFRRQVSFGVGGREALEIAPAIR